MKKVSIILADEILSPMSDPIPRGLQKQFPISIILLCCAAMFLWPTASLAQQFNIHTNSSFRFVSGNFSYAFAYVYDSYAGYGIGENNVGPVSYPGGIGTAPQVVTGWYFAPHAQVNATTTATPAGIDTSMIANHGPGIGPQAPPPTTIRRGRSG
jgi:hypothetical protein